MIRQILANPTPVNIVVVVFSYLIIFLISFPIHESAHALMAKWLGDSTAELKGRISLNPLDHLDPMGTLLMLLCGFGWAKPVPVQAYKARKVSMRNAMAITALAGPVSNVLIALIAVIIAKIVIVNNPGEIRCVLSPFYYYVSDNVTYYIVTALDMIMDINIGLAVFNLIPLPPLDGSHIVSAFLPNKIYFSIMKYERQMRIGLFILMASSLLSTPLSYLSYYVSKGLDFITSFIC